MARKKRSDKSRPDEPTEQIPKRDSAELPPAPSSPSPQIHRLKIVGLNRPDAEPSQPSRPALRLRPEPGQLAEPPRQLRDPFFARSTRLLDFLAAVFLVVGGFLSVVLTYRGIGHSWDEALYLQPSASAGQWLMDVLRGAPGVFEAHAIDRAWGIDVSGEDPLHPEVASIPKIVIGAGLSVLTGYGVPEMKAMRLPIAVAFGLTLGLLYILGARTYGRTAGLVGALAYATMPRVFGHAHIAASETLFALSVVFLAWSYLLGIQRGWYAILTALAFAFSFDTKVTALFLPLALLVWGQVYYRREYGSNIFALAVGGPIFIWVLWPWLWHDPLPRLAEYLKFYAHHQNTAVFYMGRIWGYIYGPPAPWHYPLVITGLSLPVSTLALALIGVASTIFLCRRRPVPVLYLVFAATIMGVCSLPRVPKYDGERLFFGAFPFLGLLAGGGFHALDQSFRWLEERGHGGAKLLGWLLRIGITACLVGNVWTIAKVHPDELNFYNSLIGGTKGAYEKGFETSYWGEAVNEEVIDYLNGLTTPGTKFKPLALNERVFLNLQGWGLLSDEATYVAATEPYDYYILQVRQGFFGNRERALHFGARPLKVFETGGVPKIEIFAGDALSTRTRTTTETISRRQDFTPRHPKSHENVPAPRTAEHRRSPDRTSEPLSQLSTQTSTSLRHELTTATPQVLRARSAQTTQSAHSVTRDGSSSAGLTLPRPRSTPRPPEKKETPHADNELHFAL